MGLSIYSELAKGQRQDETKEEFLSRVFTREG